MYSLKYSNGSSKTPQIHVPHLSTSLKATQFECINLRYSWFLNFTIGRKKDLEMEMSIGIGRLPTQKN